MVYIQWEGNRKMRIPVFSLPPSITCIGATDICRKICYGRKSWIYENVRKRRLENYIQSSRDDFVEIMRKELRKRPFKYFRIHETGDFYSQAYLEKWFEIAEEFKNAKFLAFTKSWQLDYSQKPENMIVYYSVMPDSKVIRLDMKLAFVIGKGLKYKNLIVSGRICKYPEVTCDKCGYKCWDGDRNVIFHKH